MTDTSNTVVKRAIVIGSGFGGAVTACRLVEAAQQNLKQRGASSERWEVLVIERGRKYGKEDFPRLQLPESMTSSEDLKSSQRIPDFGRFSWRSDYGLFDTRNLGGLLVMQAAGFGGGSLIYANVLLRAPQSELRKWPQAYHADQLKPYYALAETMLGATIAPSLYPKTAVFEETVEKLGRKFMKLPLAVNFPSEVGTAQGTARNEFGREQGTCNGCGDCVIGCPRHAKNTLDLNYLAIVEDARSIAQIWTMAEVTHIRRAKAAADPSGGAQREFVVDVVRHDQGEKTQQVYADYVFLCAGAIGTTELLWHNKDDVGLSDEAKAEVGKRLFGNGDSLGVVFETEAASTPWVGPTITRGMVHVEAGPSGEEKDGSRRQRTLDDSATWFMLQDGGIPPSLRRILGYFHSGMWLGRNRFKSPRDSSASVPQRAGPLTDLFLDLPLLTGLFRRDDTPRPAAKEPVWRRYVPKDVYPLIDFLVTPQDRLIKELKEIDKLVLERVQVEFGRRFGLASWFPGLRSVFNEDLLLESVLAALRERYKVLGYLPKSHDFVGSLVATAAYLAFGHGPTANSFVLLCMGPDDAWTLRSHEGGPLRADRDRDGERADVNLYGTQDRVLRDFAKQLGGELRTNPNWTVGKRPVTVHAQGGSGMSTRYQRATATVDQPGVTDENGRVIGALADQPHLYVMDAAGFPASVGVNPSLTVAAVAERKIEHFITTVMGLPAFKAHSAAQPKLLNEEVTPVDALLKTIPVEHKPVGLKWLEWMEGSVGSAGSVPTPSVWHCSNGEKLGLSEGTYVQLALRCQVEDLEGFYLQPRPLVLISGETTIRDRSGAKVVYSTKGALRLEFERERMVRMVYQLQLQGAQSDLQLHGIKFLSDDAGLDSFLDLTTLYVVVSGKSNADSGPLERPGIVRAPLVQFLSKQVPTFELTGAEDLDAVGKLWAAARFADFFFAGLKQTYLPELFVKRLASAEPKATKAETKSNV
jgi:choline dehydrogenase-like flavoprotein